MTIPGGYVAGDILTAANMNLLPAGKVGYAEVTSAQNGIVAVGDITSLTVTWTAVSARRYRTSFVVPVDRNWTASSLSMSILITDGSNTQIGVTKPVETTSADTAITLVGSVTETSLSGSTTRKLRMNFTSNGTDSVDVPASATNKAYILVEDIGPA